MKISEMNWMQVEEYLKTDTRCILPIGSTEQHAFLSLAVDHILAEKVSVDAAEPLGIPVFPVLPYGLAPYYQAFPGSMTLRINTYVQVIRELLDGIRTAGFRQVLIVNGHGGNRAASGLAVEYMLDHPEMRIKFHNWWEAPLTWAEVMKIDSDAGHASWSENFPWTRLQGVALPEGRKKTFPENLVPSLNPQQVREGTVDGQMGGVYQKPDDVMLRIWDVAVAETRALLEESWSV